VVLRHGNLALVKGCHRKQPGDLTHLRSRNASRLQRRIGRLGDLRHLVEGAAVVVREACLGTRKARELRAHLRIGRHALRAPVALTQLLLRLLLQNRVSITNRVTLVTKVLLAAGRRDLLRQAALLLRLVVLRHGNLALVKGCHRKQPGDLTHLRSRNASRLQRRIGRLGDLRHLVEGVAVVVREACLGTREARELGAQRRSGLLAGLGAVLLEQWHASAVSLGLRSHTLHFLCKLGLCADEVDLLVVNLVQQLFHMHRRTRIRSLKGVENLVRSPLHRTRSLQLILRTSTL